MLDVCLLGTGGMLPLKNRHLASALFRLNGKSLLIDCGEGTQVALRKAGLTFKPIDIICLTHFHADHITGLPGFLLSMGNEGRSEKLIIAGPAGVSRIVSAVTIVARELPFEVEFIEIPKTGMEFFVSGFNITAFPVNHNVQCLGYRLDIPRMGKFCPEKAQALNIPVKLWGVLQKGENAEYEGNIYTPQMVLGEDRKGISVTYCTDTRPTELIEQMAKDTDLFICEGMFGEEDKLNRAIETGHMLMSEAGKIAKLANVKKLWLTHFSPAVPHPSEYSEKMRGIFSNTQIGEDGLFETVRFED